MARDRQAAPEITPMETKALFLFTVYDAAASRKALELTGPPGEGSPAQVQGQH